MKRIAFIPLLLALLLCGSARGESGEPGFRVAVASDLHYIAPALTDHGPFFTALTENSDGKLMRYMEELTDAFLAEVEAERPDALLLTGDLSFNGAVMSHEALAEKLRRLEEAGLPVLVVPGNHDLDNPGAAAFSGDGFTRVPSASASVFREIYRDFGYDEALSEDADSLSYVCPLNDTARVMMLDFNTRDHPCGISDGTFRWVRGQLEDARRTGVFVLAAGHQNIFQQTVFRGSYVIDRAEELAALFREYGVPLYLSGHLHVQHWMTADGLTEIATSALSVSPCQYGIVSAEDGALRYETRVTDVSAWARAEGRTEPELLDFAAYAVGYFDARNRKSTAEELSLSDYTAEEIERMTEYLVALNRAYFSGDMRAAADLDPDGEIRALWDRYPGLYSLYLASIRGDMGQDYRRWTG